MVPMTLSDLRFLDGHDLARSAELNDYGNVLVELGLAIAINGRLRVTDAGFGVLEACADVVLEGS